MEMRCNDRRLRSTAVLRAGLAAAMLTAPRALSAAPAVAPRIELPAIAALFDDAVTGGQDVPRASPGPTVDLEAPLLLNGRLIGEIDVSADLIGNGTVDAKRFLGLLTPLLDPQLIAALRLRIAGRARVKASDLSVSSLAVRFDSAALELHVTAPTSALTLQNLSLSGIGIPRPEMFQPQARFAGGVALAADQTFIESGPDAGRAPFRLSADGFVTVGAFPGLTLRGGGTFTERVGGYTFEREQTRLSYDWFAKAIHAVAGEFTSTATGFQGAGQLLGIGIARDYAGIRPFENIRPSGRGFVTIERASTIIVETNGVETRRLRVDPGRYQLTDLSSQFGANDVRLLIEDQFGRRELASASFFAATAMLAGGLTDFGFHIGKQTSNQGGYDGPFTLTGYVRHGFGDVVTLGMGAQTAGSDWQLTGEAVVGTPIGLFRAQAAASRIDGRGGQAFSLDYLQTFEWAGGTWNLTMLANSYSSRFGSPFDRNGRFNDTAWRIDGRIDYRRADFGLGLTASIGRSRANDQRDGVEATGYVSRGRLVFTGTAGIEREGGGAWGPRVLLGVSLRLSRRVTASLQGDSNRSQIVAEIDRSPVDQVGDLSGRLQVRRSDGAIGLAGEARYFGNRFIAGVQQSDVFATTTAITPSHETRVRFTTFAGFADGAVAIGRPPFGGFAIYDRHATLANAQVTVRDESGLLVGRQDWLGSALVPFNRVFSPVEHSYDVDPLPVGYDLGEGRLLAFPGAASGYRVAVGSDASRVALGFLVAPSGPLANFSAEARKLGGDRLTRPFFTNAEGRFAIDRLSPGTYLLLIGGTEVARITIPAKSEGLVDVGRLAATAP
ncbi:fimbria/pilus outer membrane usher protein [Sphingomonas sp. PAMC 26605]|uniref:fimbria/pilus outer membrane usher protein n=1 Tax=Sphingomonas sp. PAMC 26605 TaxID=1112214 RepID=UPI0002E211BC|nr:fimbria/pilus outer membrane usher protein [Sphingomonas sp. PAMC 26605]